MYSKGPGLSGFGARWIMCYWKIINDQISYQNKKWIAFVETAFVIYLNFTIDTVGNIIEVLWQNNFSLFILGVFWNWVFNFNIITQMKKVIVYFLKLLFWNWFESHFASWIKSPFWKKKISTKWLNFEINFRDFFHRCNFCIINFKLTELDYSQNNKTITYKNIFKFQSDFVLKFSVLQRKNFMI